MNKLLIGDFEGPLDLLLHLLKQSKMDINEIKISLITEEYLKFIEQMEELNLDIASEYLVMAAELIEMKSRSLLPNTTIEENSEMEENPEEELKRRLLEYQKYKETTSELKKLEEKRTSYFTKSPERLTEFINKPLTNDGSITAAELLNALEKLLARKNYQKPLNTKITKKELSVKQRVDKIRDILKSKREVTFISLFEELTKPYVVVTFLGVLEMAKNNEIIIKQKDNFGSILIERVDN